MKQSHNPPPLVNSDRPSEGDGWSFICELIGNRWPSWEPTPQELRDWRHMLRNLDTAWLDEALLHVRSRYASDIPKLKWVLDAYYKVRDQQRQVTPPKVEEEKAVAEQMLMQQVQDDKRECIAFLGAQSHDTLIQARNKANKKFPFLCGSTSNDHNQWGWVTKYAVKFILEGQPNV